MDKNHILAEIKRTAVDNDGQPLGIARFAKATGIAQGDWQGVYWARWGDALQEAGFEPNSWNGSFDEQYLLGRLATFIKDNGYYPTKPEFKLEHRRDKTFPCYEVFKRRFDTKRTIAAKLIEFCESREDHGKVLEVCRPLCQDHAPSVVTEVKDSELQEGYVYLLKSGRHYKVGRSNSHGRREYEIAIQLPEKTEKVHVIATDDPVGIEAYWHNRFVDKRKNGEWFDLSAADVKAFKRRKFM